MTETPSSAKGLLSTRSGLILFCFIAIIGFLLFTEHRAHVLGFLPYALLLLCLLLHMFHHGGHGGHGGHGEHGGHGDHGGGRHRPGGEP